jgi:hypothetical protein
MNIHNPAELMRAVIVREQKNGSSAKPFKFPGIALELSALISVTIQPELQGRRFCSPVFLF